MKYVSEFFFLLALIIGQDLTAQSASGIEVQYHCMFNRDFDRSMQPIPYFATLWSNEAGSYFYAVRDPSVEVPRTDDDIFDPDTLMRVQNHTASGEMIFGVVNMAGKEVMYRDTLNPVQWVLTDEQKKIDSLTCYKATAVFRGRSYVAWYAPAVPVQAGPWKLGGLPGLVIEAYDDKKNLHFLARTIKTSGSMPLSKAFGNPDLYPDFPKYVNDMRDFLKRIKAAVSANADPNCIQCQTESQVKLYLWEKVLD